MRVLARPFLLHLVVLALSSTPGWAESGNARILTYCTNVGPVRLLFSDQGASGSYTIILEDRTFGGSIEGRFEDHLLEARWRDPDGTGRIVFAFGSDRERFTAVYNSEEEPNEWYSWKGVLNSAIGDDERSDFVCGSAASLASADPRTCDQRPAYIQGGRVWTANGTFKRADILIENGVVAAVSEHAEPSLPENARVLDATGMSVLPGLIDLHSHFFELGGPLPSPVELSSVEQNFSIIATSSIRSGVTTARAHLFDLEYGPRLAARSQDNCDRSPRIQFAGPGFIGGVPDLSGFQVWGVESPDDARDKVRLVETAGADWVALHEIERFSMRELHAIVEEARERGLRILVAGDKPDSIRRGLEIGADTIEYMDLTTAQHLPQDIIETLRNHPRPPTFVPTLSYYARSEEGRESPDAIDFGLLEELMPPGRLKSFRRTVRETFENNPSNEIRDAYATLAPKFEQLLKSGAPIGVGTDNGSPGHFHYGAVWREMRMLFEMGMSAQAVIESATRGNARVLGLRNAGVVTPGARADLILYSGDLDNGEFAVEHVKAVLKGGVVISGTGGA